MIFDSHYWRRALRASAADLRMRKKQVRWTEATFGNVERSVMTGAYTVRKLLESKLVAQKLLGANWPLEAFPFRGGPHRWGRIRGQAFGFRLPLNY
jgi:hypothetical protein